jgi:hypothetical protein
MPGTGYNKEAMHIGSIRSGTRSWRCKLGVLLVFATSIAIGAAVAGLLK